MKNKIDVRICVGTHCYVMGGKALMKLEEEMPESWKSKVDIRGAVSLGACEERGEHPPYAEVNGKTIEKATLEKLKSAIEKELNR
ncbi:MAG: NAD(P)H-dependent oxidoreductase subunit E [Bacteroidales bacterium]